MGGRGKRAQPSGAVAVQPSLPAGAATLENPGIAVRSDTGEPRSEFYQNVRREQIQAGLDTGQFYVDRATGDRVATPPPRGAPRFPLQNAERGTKVLIDGDPNKPAVVWRGRTGGKQALVHPAGRGYGAMSYPIDRTRMKVVG